jgi:ribosomal protein S18
MHLAVFRGPKKQVALQLHPASRQMTCICARRQRRLREEVWACRLKVSGST